MEPDDEGRDLSSLDPAVRRAQERIRADRARAPLSDEEWDATQSWVLDIRSRLQAPRGTQEEPE